jgi:thymidylate synthase
VRLLIVIQGQWGQRIADHLCATAPTDWQVEAWQGPIALPTVIDDPEEYLPGTLPKTDLLLVLTESAGLTDLAPDLAQLCGADAVIVPIDKRAWAPPGLRGQVERRLRAMDVGAAFPLPFCSLLPRGNQHPLIGEFAARYGRPELTCARAHRHVASCAIVREAPCGNTRYIVERLSGVPVAKAAGQAGLLHHYYPCWGGMGVDPVQGTHTPLHIAATIAQKSVERALKND